MSSYALCYDISYTVLCCKLRCVSGIGLACLLIENLIRSLNFSCGALWALTPNGFMQVLCFVLRFARGIWFEILWFGILAHTGVKLDIHLHMWTILFHSCERLWWNLVNQCMKINFGAQNWDLRWVPNLGLHFGPTWSPIRVFRVQTCFFGFFFENQTPPSTTQSDQKKNRRFWTAAAWSTRGFFYLSLIHIWRCRRRG